MWFSKSMLPCAGEIIRYSVNGIIHVGIYSQELVTDIIGNFCTDWSSVGLWQYTDYLTKTILILDNQVSVF